MSSVIGIGIDLTQHVPLVCFARCPEAVSQDGAGIDSDSLAEHWPPPLELHGNFGQQPPVALLPVTPGEPLLVGNPAATHRRSAGFAWPPESQFPFGGDPSCGVGRIPLVASWLALLPRADAEQSMRRREDHEF